MKQLVLIFAILFSIIFQLLAQADNRINTAFNHASISYYKDSNSPYEIRFNQVSGITELDFFTGYKSYFGLSDDFNFVQIQETSDQLNQIHYRYNEYYKGIEIIGAQFILHNKNEFIHYANGHLVNEIDLSVSPSIAEEFALQFALKHIGAKTYMWEKESNEAFIKKEQQNPEATYYPKGVLKLTSGTKQLSEENIKLVYRFDIYSEYPMSRVYIDVDANTGEIVNVISRIMETDVPGSGESLYNGVVPLTVDEIVPDTSYRLQEHTTRTVVIESYDMLGGSDYGAAVDFISVSANGPWDSVGVSGHLGAEATFDYYLNEHGRNSLDNAGFPMRNYIHADLVGLGWEDYIGAFWDGNGATYGDGDGINAFPVISLDIVGHEFTHGVTQFSANLIYQAESGALNESFSGIFGNLVEFMIEGNPGVGTGSWRIAEDVDISGIGATNMANPNELGHPDTYLGNFWAPLNGPDNGGVHTNCAVQSYWFYLLSEGGSGINDDGYNYNVTGIGLSDAAKIVYRNLTVYLIPSSEYFDARVGALNAAADLFGAGSPQYLSVTEAWAAVGVYYPFLEQTVGVSPDLIYIASEVNIAPGTANVVISNLGLQPLIVDSIQVSSSQFEITSSPQLPIELTELQDNFTISVAFTSTDTGTVNETLSIYSNDPVNPNKSVPLNGVGYVINAVQDTTFYASSGGVNGEIILLDKSTGVGITVGSSNYSIINSLSINPVTDILYGAISYSLQSSIVIVNASEGDAYSKFTLDLGYISIAFDTSGNLYGGARTGEIYSIDLTDGSYNLLTTTTIQINAITFNPLTNEMWAAPNIYFGDDTDKIYKINLLNGEATEIGKTGLNKMTNDLAFDEMGMLYGVIGLPVFIGELISIDTSSAVATLIGETGFEDVQGLAYNPGTIVSVEDENALLPTHYSLMQNYPNPFNPSTSIQYSIKERSSVELVMYDVLGREVEVLVKEQQDAGYYKVHFNAGSLSSEVYFYRLKAGNFVETKKMLLLK
jgi:Zn-dependent metalloprotease